MRVGLGDDVIEEQRFRKLYPDDCQPDAFVHAGARAWQTARLCRCRLRRLWPVDIIIGVALFWPPCALTGRLELTSSGMGDWLGDFRRKAFLIGLGLGGLLHRLDLLFHWLEGGSEHGGGQLGNVPAITDSGFNPFLDQPLLQLDELRRAFHCGQRLHRSGQVLGILGRQFLNALVSS